jgi:hypothetical protein
MFIQVFQSNFMGTEAHSGLERRKWICKLLCVKSWRRPRFHPRPQPTYKTTPRFKKISLAAQRLHPSKSNLMTQEVQLLRELVKGQQRQRNPTFTNHSLNQQKNRLIM